MKPDYIICTNCKKEKPIILCIMQLELCTECHEKQQKKELHKIIIGDNDIIYKGYNRKKALKYYKECEKQSIFSYSRANNKPVKWLIDDNIYVEFEV